MNKKQHTDALSNTTLKNINQSKYNKVKLSKVHRDISQDYYVTPQCWRNKQKAHSVLS